MSSISFSYYQAFSISFSYFQTLVLVSSARPFTDSSVKGLPSEINFFISDKSLDKKCKFKGQAKNIYLFVSRTYGTISVFVLTSFSG